MNKQRVASRGDERLGLTRDQMEEAEMLAHEKNRDAQVSDVHYRLVRNKPLLMIHSLEPKGGKFPGPIAAFGISFPGGDYSTTIQAVVNQVWLQKMQGYDDNPDAEDDFDE